MSQPKILAISCVTPPYRAELQDVVAQAQQWVTAQPDDFQVKALKIFERAEVASRYTVLPLSEIFSPMTLSQKNDIYKEAVVGYAETALRQALKDANLTPQDIDCLITNSCTGHMSPSLDAILMNRLGMKPTVQRLPVMEMGCIGGVSGLMYAENYLRAYPERYVALICAELSSITFQHEDFSWANIVSTAIFGDGIACAILGSSSELRPSIIASQMHHFPETTELLGFNLCNSGFQMVLDGKLPEQIRQEFLNFTEALLTDFNLNLSDIQYFMIHPGGTKIIRKLEAIIKPYAKNLDDSKAILRDYGNVSSATILFILERFLRKPILSGEKGLITGFGPGLTAGSILLEWT